MLGQPAYNRAQHYAVFYARFDVLPVQLNSNTHHIHTGKQGVRQSVRPSSHHIHTYGAMSPILFGMAFPIKFVI